MRLRSLSSSYSFPTTIKRNALPAHKPSENSISTFVFKLKSPLSEVQRRRQLHWVQKGAPTQSAVPGQGKDFPVVLSCEVQAGGRKKEEEELSPSLPKVVGLSCSRTRPRNVQERSREAFFNALS